jgi:curved DNA-binding protein CbpA
MNKKSKNYYEELGVSPDATDEEIRLAFRRKAKQVHPDRKDGSHEAMSAANRAAEVLLNKQRRLTYDRTGEDKPTDIVVKAREKLVSVLLNEIANPENDQPYRIDILAIAAAKLIQEQQTFENNIRNAALLVKRMKKQIKRIKFKGKGKSTLIQMMEYQIHKVENETGKADDNLEIIKAAIILTKDFEFEAADQPASQQIFTIGLSQ